MTEQLLQVKKAAEKLGISGSFLYQLIERREISCFRIGRRALFSQEQIDDYLSFSEVKAEHG